MTQSSICSASFSEVLQSQLACQGDFFKPFLAFLVRWPDNLVITVLENTAKLNASCGYFNPFIPSQECQT